MSEKSILEQALLQINTLEEAVKQNAKGILASTMKEELSDLLKESLEEEEKVDEQPADDAKPEEEEKDDMSDEEGKTADDEEADDTDDAENVDNLDNDETSADDSDDFGAADDTDTSMDDMGGEDTDMDDMGGEDVMDMTNASDDEVMKVFKAMKPEDGIVVKKDGNKLEFGVGDDEYIIKLDDEDESEMDEEEVPMSDESSSVSDESSMPTEETLYEIELDEDEDAPFEKEVNETEDAPFEKKATVKKNVHEDKNAPFGKKAKVTKDVHEDENEPFEKEVHEDEDAPFEKEVHEDENAPFEKSAKKVEATEAARTKSNIHGDKNDMNRAGIKSKTKYKAGSGTINEEVETLKKQNAEYKKALVLFKDKLNEVAVFNANLAYATRLFTEHSTTKQEKLNILKRFDTVNSLNESKSLFNTIKTELGSKTTVTEAVAEKISTTPSTSSSQEVLAESKAYENPQFKRMKDLMSKIK
jgi:hypothetical protein